MTTVLVCSTLRDMEKHPNWGHIGMSPITTFLNQLEDLDHLCQENGIRLNFSFYENDSKDSTPDILKSWQPKGVFEPALGKEQPRKKPTVVCETHGERLFRSLPAHKGQERIALYAKVRNRVLEAYDNEDWVLFVEPDIMYRPDTLLYLLAGDGDIRSPLSFSHPHNLLSFYDPLSTRDMDGNKFQWAWPPANTQKDQLAIIKGEMLELSSTWNCFCLVRGEVIKRGVRFSGDREGESEASSFCQDARALGFKVSLYPSVRYSTFHPLAPAAWSENSG